MSKTRSSLKPSISRTETNNQTEEMLKNLCIGCARNVTSLEIKNEIILAQDRNILAQNTG
jgi:DNA-binding protein YbaB